MGETIEVVVFITDMILIIFSIIVTIIRYNHKGTYEDEIGLGLVIPVVTIECICLIMAFCLFCSER